MKHPYCRGRRHRDVREYTSRLHCRYLYRTVTESLYEVWCRKTGHDAFRSWDVVAARCWVSARLAANTPRRPPRARP